MPYNGPAPDGPKPLASPAPPPPKYPPNLPSPIYDVETPVQMEFNGSYCVDGIVKDREFAEGQWWYHIEIDTILNTKVVTKFTPENRIRRKV